MSIKTWKKKFYPSISKACKSQRGAIEHSLHKWKGLLSKNLKKHGLIVLGCRITDGNYYGDSFYIDAASCALCYKYPLCENCPLYKVSGKDCCMPNSPYVCWVQTGNPGPMIRALKKTLKEYKNV